MTISDRDFASPTLTMAEPPIFICLFGAFRVLKSGAHVPVTKGSKVEAFLACLALRHQHAVARDELLSLLWPECDTARASQSLNSLVYSVHKMLSHQNSGQPAVVQTHGYYQFNADAGILIDVNLFAARAHAGDQHLRAGAAAEASIAYAEAVNLYQGDICVGSDVNALLAREHLRTRYLATLSWLADHNFAQQNYLAALGYIHRLLTCDPCREDAHRLAMRCYVRSGHRAQGLRQYQLCRTVLQLEFDAEPEPATTALYHQVRVAPDTV